MASVYEPILGRIPFDFVLVPMASVDGPIQGNIHFDFDLVHISSVCDTITGKIPINLKEFPNKINESYHSMYGYFYL